MPVLSSALLVGLKFKSHEQTFKIWYLVFRGTSISQDFHFIGLVFRDLNIGTSFSGLQYRDLNVGTSVSGLVIRDLCIGDFCFADLHIVYPSYTSQLIVSKELPVLSYFCSNVSYASTCPLINHLYIYQLHEMPYRCIWCHFQKNTPAGF